MVCEETRAVRLQSIGLEQGRKREGEPKLFLKMRRLSWGEKMKCTHLDWRQPRVKTEQELRSQTDLGSHAFSFEAVRQEASRGTSLRFRTRSVKWRQKSFLSMVRIISHWEDRHLAKEYNCRGRA